MNYAKKAIPPLIGALLGVSLSAPMVGQPLCEVLLNPAFDVVTYGLQVEVTDTSTTFGIPATAIWSFGDGSSLTTASDHLFQASGTYDVCLTLSTTEFPCSATYCRQITVPASDCGGMVDANFNWLPTGTNAVLFSDASTTTNTGTTLWEFGDGNTSIDNGPEHTWLIPGPYFVTLTRGVDSCLVSRGRWVEVDGNVTTCGPGLFVDFTTTSDGNGNTFVPNIVTNNTIPLVSIWSYGDGTIDTVTVGQHVYQNIGPHQTCLLVGAITTPSLDSCFALVCQTSEVLPLVSLDEPGTPTIGVWPNPFNRNFHFRVEGNRGISRVRLVDTLGRTVLEKDVPGNGTYAVDTGSLATGPYVLHVNGPGSVQRTRLIKVLE